MFSVTCHTSEEFLKICEETEHLKRHKKNNWVPKIPWEKGMATYSSILAWRILWTGEPGRLQSMGSQRVGQDLSTEQQQQQQMAIVLRLGNSNIKGLKDDRVYLMLKLQITCKNLISLGL